MDVFDADEFYRNTATSPTAEGIQEIRVLVPLFLEDAENGVAIMRAGLTSALDREAVQIAAHSLKGGAATFGLPQLNQSAARLEAQVRDEAPRVSLMAELQVVERDLQAAREALDLFLVELEIHGV